MVIKLPLIITSVATAFVISGCSLEATDQEQQRVASPYQDIENTLTEKAQQDFFNHAKQCILGDPSLIDEIVLTYNSSLPVKDRPKVGLFLEDSFQEQLNAKGSKPYLYQTKMLTLMYENCLQKASSLKSKDYLQYFVTRAFVIARLSQHYYLEKDYLIGSYWQQRAINLVGLSQGNYILGREFVKNPKTLQMGADMLAFAATLNNQSAISYLNDYVIYQNIFDKLQEESIERANSRN